MMICFLHVSYYFTLCPLRGSIVEPSCCASPACVPIVRFRKPSRHNKRRQRVKAQLTSAVYRSCSQTGSSTVVPLNSCVLSGLKRSLPYSTHTEHSLFFTHGRRVGLCIDPLNSQPHPGLCVSAITSWSALQPGQWNSSSFTPLERTRIKWSFAGVS